MIDVDSLGCAAKPNESDGEDVQHRCYQAVQGAGRSTRLVRWSGGRERAMVVDGYVSTTIPGTDMQVRALADRPLALRYRLRA